MSKVSTFSCHGYHTKNFHKDTTNLYEELVKYIKTVRTGATPDICDIIAAEILNRTVIINLAPSGELLYDDPNLITAETLTNLDIYWTFSYDLDIKKYNENTLKSKKKSADYQIIYNIKKKIIEELIAIIEELKSSPLEIIFTTANDSKPSNKKKDDIYSYIELFNKNINKDNIYFLKTLINNSKTENIPIDIDNLIYNVKHTRFWIGVQKNKAQSEINECLSIFYDKMINILTLINEITSLRNYSNNLVYFSPNIEQLSKTFASSLDKINVTLLKTTNLKQNIKHPFIKHSEIANGYSLMCGVDYKLSRRNDDIVYARYVGNKVLRFEENYDLSILEQLKRHFYVWINKIKIDGTVVSKRLPTTSPYIIVVHACNECLVSDEYETGTCECGLNMEPEIYRTRKFKSVAKTDWIKYSASSSKE
jgi:hypothetical protein